jgi:iron-sulfur cluster assembly protein
MLTLTDNARLTVEGLAAQAELPETGGLRIAQSEAQGGTYELSLVTAPQDDDQVIDTGAAKVFVEASTADVLASQSLDAELTEQGPGFMLAPQAPLA